MSAPELRPYQFEAIEASNRAYRRGVSRIILVCPTGGGKTVIAGEMIRRRVLAGGRVLVLAHRREIVRQTSRKLADAGVDHGIILAGELLDPDSSVQLAGVQTLHSRAMRRGKIELPPANLLFVDECHHATAATWRKIIAAYPDAVLIGLTATPCRGDGRGLGGIFQELIETPQVPELIEQGYLVGTRVYAPTVPDLTGVRVQAGDYVEAQLAERMDRPKLVGDICTHWFRHAEGRKTVIFATGVQHSVHIRDEFVKLGVRCEHLDGSTPKDERDRILERLGTGEAQIVTNCMVLTEGWDMPEVGCCVLARPTRKMGLHRQMIGRVLRPAPGKTDAIVIDHAGAVHRHGFVEDRVYWTLDPERLAENPTHAKRSIGELHSRLIDCTQCGALRTGGEPCRHCGFMPKAPPRYVPTIDADLAKITRNGSVKHQVDPIEWHRQLSWIGNERGYKLGWAAHKYKEKFGTWPPRPAPTPMPPTAEVRSWVRSRLIAYAKGRAA